MSFEARRSGPTRGPWKAVGQPVKNRPPRARRSPPPPHHSAMEGPREAPELEEPLLKQAEAGQRSRQRSSLRAHLGCFRRRAWAWATTWCWTGGDLTDVAKRRMTRDGRAFDALLPCGLLMFSKRRSTFTEVLAGGEVVVWEAGTPRPAAMTTEEVWEALGREGQPNEGELLGAAGLVSYKGTSMVQRLIYEGCRRRESVPAGAVPQRAAWAEPWEGWRDRPALPLSERWPRLEGGQAKTGRRTRWEVVVRRWGRVPPFVRVGETVIVDLGIPADCSAEKPPWYSVVALTVGGVRRHIVVPFGFEAVNTAHGLRVSSIGVTRPEIVFWDDSPDNYQMPLWGSSRRRLKKLTRARGKMDQQRMLQLAGLLSGIPMACRWCR